MYASYRSYSARHAPTAASVTYHDKPHQTFLGRYHELIVREVKPGVPLPAAIRQQLFHYITHPNNLRLAWDYLAQQGGQAPGPNGHRYGEYGSNDVWQLLRALSAALQSGHYRPGPERTVQIPKLSGHGERTLHLANIEDRVVQRAMLQILQPLLDPTFSELSFGYRPGRDRRHALARAQQLAIGQGLWNWIVDDIRDCYDHIPCGRLIQILSRRLPDDVLQLLQLVACGDRKRGVRQGAPLSALLVNVYLDHFLDRPWQRKHPDAPLLRTADDILVLAASPEQAAELYDELTGLLRRAGLPLKGDSSTAIHNMAAGDKATWLGFDVGAADKALSVELAPRAWKQLDSALDKAHEKPLAAQVAELVATGWLRQAAPCHMTTAFPELMGRVRGRACDHGFEELPEDPWFEQRWLQAVAAWQRIAGDPQSVTSAPEQAWDWASESEDDVPF